MKTKFNIEKDIIEYNKIYTYTYTYAKGIWHIHVYVYVCVLDCNDKQNTTVDWSILNILKTFFFLFYFYLLTIFDSY